MTHPKEPTPEMIEAGAKVLLDNDEWCGNEEDFADYAKRIYLAMLAKAPTPATSEDVDAGMEADYRNCEPNPLRNFAEKIVELSSTPGDSDGIIRLSMKDARLLAMVYLERSASPTPRDTLVKASRSLVEAWHEGCPYKEMESQGYFEALDAALKDTQQAEGTVPYSDDHLGVNKP